MNFITQRLIALLLLFISITSSAFDSGSPLHFDFNTITSHPLTNNISMRFVTSSQFTVIQWNLKKGAKLPIHSHPNEQVIRVLQGNIEARSENNTYHLHPNDVMIFPPNIEHGFIATSDAIIYEQQTPIRQDFLQPDFIEKLSQYLKQHQ